MNLSNVPDFDPLYFRRESVELRGAIPKLLDVLVDAARDIIIHLVSDDSGKASALMERWFASEAAILRRLAVFGYSIRRDLAADDKLKWLLDNDLLFRFHAEVRAVLNDSYGLSTRQVRSELLSRVTKGPASDARRRMEIGKDSQVLDALTSLAPDCPLTSEQLRLFLEQYPRFVREKKTEETAQEISNRFMNARGDFDIDKVAAGSAE